MHRNVPEWSVADRLRKIRREVARLDQGEFAAAIGVKADRYGAWESGRNGVPSDILVPLAKRIEAVTGVPAEWTVGLMDGTPPDGGGGGGLEAEPISRNRLGRGALPRLDSNQQPSDWSPESPWTDRGDWNPPMAA